MAVLHPLMKTGVMRVMDYLRGVLLETWKEAKAIQRLYLIGRRDEVVDWTAVLEHAEKVMAKGFEVRSVVFERSGHCALPIENGDMYWREIEALWNGRLEREETSMKVMALGADDNVGMKPKCRYEVNFDDD